jgi:hypothetical protein
MKTHPLKLVGQESSMQTFNFCFTFIQGILFNTALQMVTLIMILKE